MCDFPYIEKKNYWIKNKYLFEYSDTFVWNK